MKQINFYSIELSISFDDGSNVRYFDDLEIVKRILHSELDKVLSGNDHVSIHVNFGDGSKPFFFHFYRHNFSILSENDIKVD